MIQTHQPMHANDFRFELGQPRKPRKPIIQGLLYDQETTYLVAGTGVGKSTLLTQIALSLTCAHPVFGVFEVPRPMTVYMVCAETSKDDQMDMIERMMKVIPANLDNLCWDQQTMLALGAPENNDLDDFVTRVSSKRYTMSPDGKTVERNWNRPDVFTFDPLNLVAGDSINLNDASVGTRITRCLRHLCTVFKSANIITHHTHKEKLAAFTGKPVQEKSSEHGSGFFKNGAGMMWQVSDTGEGAGTDWTIKKDRKRASEFSGPREFRLTFDSDTYCSWLSQETENDVTVAIQQFLFALPDKCATSYESIAAALHTTKAYVKNKFSRVPVLAEYVRKNGEKGRETVLELVPKNERPRPPIRFA